MNQQVARGTQAPRPTGMPVQGKPVLRSTPPSTSKPIKPPKMHIWFQTPWMGPSYLHGSVCGGEWKDIPLRRAGSAPRRWSSVTLPMPQAPPAAGVPLLEFVVRNDNNEWNKPSEVQGGGNYTIDAAGCYTIKDGAISLSQGTPVMIVSDLDGTMVGDDSATTAFRNWWEDSAVARDSGSILVYNTGRSLPQFLELMQEKSHCLAQPDVLISAVGTKVYGFDGTSWKEDSAWTAQLDKAWDLGAVRDAAYKALAQVGKDSMHFRPKEELNEHKITCGVKVDVLDKVLASMDASIIEASVEANVITSGSGDWRYMDVVPLRAGKLEALQYVQGLYKFPTQETIACGDSGNDILMLQGENPAIVVGNSQQDLLNWYEIQKQLEADSKSGPGGLQRLFKGTKHEAHAILEGLKYWNFY